MKNNTTIWMVFVFVVWLLLSGCGSETDSGMQNALDSGHVTTDLNEADGFNPPQGSLTINDGVVATNQTDVTLKLTASDAVGVTAYYVSSQSANPTISDSNWKSVTSTSSFSKQVSETISAVEKSHYLYAWYRDNAEKISDQISASIIYDVTAPATSSVSINGGAVSTTNTVVSLTISASDSVGVTAYYTSETNSDPTNTASGWNSVTSSTAYSATMDFTISSATAAGSHSRTVYVWFKDVAGNISASASDEITLVVTDTTYPTNPGISINSGASSTTSSSVTLSLTASDETGVTGYYLSTSSSTPSSSTSGWESVTSTTSYSASVNYTLSATGTTTLYVWFRDAAGNVSASAVDSIMLAVTDTTAPYLVAISVSAGQTQTCAIDNSSSATCWGKNSYGELGNGSTSATNAPVSVDNISTATSVSTGDGHTCALLSGGTVKCWGRGVSGQLGNGSTSNQYTQVSVDNISMATAVSVGDSHSCALLSGGTVKCWGSSFSGQLGNGSSSSQNTPVSVSEISTAISISAGGRHTCAVLSGGTIKCWGYGSWGQLGYSSSGSSSQTTPVSVSGISSATSVSGGKNNTCTLLADGTVMCWGQGTQGQLGNGSTSNQNTPVSVSGISTAH
jgi:hypothetical protein